ncbi:septum formation inhibitor Maf [Euzebyella saccharophila]|uniref:Septum formation inhibitor Maf n=1 Tax=Euzebyella saccharophila TaxID=679664 RepID=A0ABV8JSG4_9FLAO|nr:septum formation inhibitor Maf [Euzebyella saccharophila]
MKTWLKFELYTLLFFSLICILESCNEKPKVTEEQVPTTKNEKPAKKNLNAEFKEYWYAGDAEISSYSLQQARYGETRDGKAVLIYVTEPFLLDKQVKADQQNPSNISVLKLNTTKNYLTGIYPYYIMSSSFYPVFNNDHAIKISFSSQEWCGQVYAQINNRDAFEVMSHSYFEKEADQSFNLEKTVLENEIWNKIRIAPEDLPQGELQIIPSLEYIRLSHKELKAYAATASLSEDTETRTYSINYPELERTLEITFEKNFPYSIQGWTETSKSGFGPNAKQMTSTATKMETLKTPYWQQNGNKDLSLRDSLGL